MILPQIMVAPNGARKTKNDHPRLPLTLDEVIADAKSCHEAGADGLHFHLRDAADKHILDAGLYREALVELQRQLSGMMLQITTEAVGLYSSSEQRYVGLNSNAQHISTAIRELAVDTDVITLRTFFEECIERDISVQHILYNPDDLVLLQETLPKETFHSPDLKLLFVLGRYAGEIGASPQDLEPFLQMKNKLEISPDWAICAFGQAETKCLRLARSQGGKVRIGFENSLWNDNGELAYDNAERVREISSH